MGVDEGIITSALALLVLAALIFTMAAVEARMRRPQERRTRHHRRVGRLRP